MGRMSAAVTPRARPATAADLEGVEEFPDMDAFRADMERRGVPFREGR